MNIPDRLAQHAGFLVYANFEVPALGVINWVRFMEHELVDIKFCYTSLFVFVAFLIRLVFVLPLCLRGARLRAQRKSKSVFSKIW